MLTPLTTENRDDHRTREARTVRLAPTPQYRTMTGLRSRGASPALEDDDASFEALLADYHAPRVREAWVGRPGRA